MIHIALSDYAIEATTAVSAIDARPDAVVANYDSILGSADSATSYWMRSPNHSYISYIDTGVTARVYSTMEEFVALEKRVAELEELVKNIWQAKSVGDLL